MYPCISTYTCNPHVWTNGACPCIITYVNTFVRIGVGMVTPRCVCNGTLHIYVHVQMVRTSKYIYRDIYIYIYIYLFIYICICIYIYIYINIYIDRYMNMYLNIYIYIYMVALCSYDTRFSMYVWMYTRSNSNGHIHIKHFYLNLF